MAQDGVEEPSGRTGPLKVQLTFDCLTPVFMGNPIPVVTDSNAAENKAAESAVPLRPSSFLNDLRWWWRAAALGRFYEKAQSISQEGLPPDRMNRALALMRISEFWLFGDSSLAFGAARLRVRRIRKVEAAEGNPHAFKERFEAEKMGTGTGYLAGTGLVSWNNKAKAFAWASASNIELEQFQVELEFLDRPLRSGRRNLKADDKARLEDVRSLVDQRLAREIADDAILLMGLVGGIGKRSRRGFGSLHLRRHEGSWLSPDKSVRDSSDAYTAPGNLEAYQEQLKSVIERCGKGLLGLKWQDLPYTCISPHTRFAIATKGTHAASALEKLGWAFLYHRSWGRGQGKVSYINYSPPKWSERGVSGPYAVRSINNYKDDHHLFRKGAASVSLAVPERSYFGLPHNYFSRDGKNGAVEYTHTKIQLPHPKSKIQRRASPLLMHILFSESAYWGCVLHMPSRFLPENEKLSYKRFIEVKRIEKKDLEKMKPIEVSFSYGDVEGKWTDGSISDDFPRSIDLFAKELAEQFWVDADGKNIENIIDGVSEREAFQPCGTLIDFIKTFNRSADPVA